MQDYQKKFIHLALGANEKTQGALSFGEFTLKSGRKSPYFFQAGILNNGLSLTKVGCYLADTIINHQLIFDGLFGPAYKGIPLVSSTAIALSEYHKHNYPWSFNRKSEKDHGEGGTIVGAPLQGKILIIDDVLTVGTAIGEAIKTIENQGAQTCGVVTLLDRCEKAQDDKSAAQLVKEKYGIPIFSVVTIYDIIEILEKKQQSKSAETILQHLELYGFPH